MYIKLKTLIAATFLVTMSSPVAAQSGIPTFAFDLYGKWGYCYQGTDFVQPCYDNVVDLGSSRAAFWAQQDGQWGLRRVDNSEIIPFVFDDVCVASGFQYASYPIKLDSITMFDRGIILPAITLERDYHYRSPLAIEAFFPLLPVKKDGKWGYVDFGGNTKIPFEYDEAFIFTRWLKGDKKRSNWLAEVRKDGQSAWIDMFGKIIIPWQKSKVFTYKEAKACMKKRKANETKMYGTQITALAGRMDSLLIVRDYVNTFDQDIKIAKVTEVTRLRSKKNRKRRVKTKTRYKILYGDGTPVVCDTVDFVFEREGDALRVKIGNKMRAINLNTGWIIAPVCDSIAPFDKKGQAKAWLDKKEYSIGVNGTWCDRNHSYRTYLDNIQSARKQGKWAEAAKEATYLSNAMQYYGSHWYRYAANATIMDVAQKYNYYCDPVLIAERERVKAENEAKKKNSGSGWSILGDLLSMAGSFSNSSTSQSLEALGETIKTVAEPGETTAETTDYSSIDTKAGTADISTLQAQVDAIDKEIEQISTRQAQMVKERVNAKTNVRNAGALGAKTQTGSNATRNFSPSKTRQRAQQRSNAQTSAKNKLSSIDSQLNQLKDRKAALLAQRAQINKQIKQLTGSQDEAYGSQSSSSKTKSAGQTKPVNTNIYTSSQKTLDHICNELSDLKVKAQNEGLTSSDRAEIKKLKAKAKEVRKNCLEQTGYTLPVNSIENWNP